jgi:predicted nucleic acid-binding protein
MPGDFFDTNVLVYIASGEPPRRIERNAWSATAASSASRY